MFSKVTPHDGACRVRLTGDAMNQLSRRAEIRRAHVAREHSAQRLRQSSFAQPGLGYSQRDHLRTLGYELHKAARGVERQHAARVEPSSLPGLLDRDMAGLDQFDEQVLSLRRRLALAGWR